jgi:hypothetical protein
LLLIAILAAGLLARGFTAIRHPAPAGDGVAAYILLADNINRGLGFTTYLKWTLYDPSMEHLRPEANRQPLFPLLLSGVFRLTGPGMRPAQVFSLAVGMLLLMVFYRWASGVVGSEAALFALAFLALDPPFIWFSAQPDSLLLYTALVFIALTAAGRGEVSPGKACLLGLVSGLAYMARTQGLFLAFSMGVWTLARGGRKRFARTALFLAVFTAVSLPWFIRNVRAFGSPAYSQNSQFVLNENHWSAWSVRETPPGPGDMLRNQGVGACAAFVLRGVLRVMEPFTTGSCHREEIFGQPTMAVFVLFALWGAADPEIRKRMLLPALVAIPLMAALTVHQHSGRYLAPVYAMTAAFGAAGILRYGAGRKGLAAAAALVTALILARPLGVLAASENRSRAEEALQGAVWIRDNVPEGTWVVTYPNVELYHWVYRRPTLTWPNDYEALLWPYLEGHGAEYLVVDRDLPALRPWLSRRWRLTPDGSGWDVSTPPDFLEEVWRSTSGGTIIYRFAGSVPEGFMAVDSLPPDNRRALGP